MGSIFYISLNNRTLSAMKKNNGLTLVELLMTLVIAGLLMGVAIPGFNSMLIENDIVSASNQMKRVASYARAEAIKRGNRTVVCQSKNNRSCATSGQYILVISDSNDNASYADSADELLKVFEPLNNNTSIKTYFQNFTNNRIVFSAQGSPESLGSIELCYGSNSPYSKGLFINFGGQLRSATTTEQGNMQCS